MPRRLSGKPSKQSRNDPSRVSSGRIHAPDRIPRFLRIPDLPLERGFIPTVAFGTHRNGRNRDAFAFRTAGGIGTGLTSLPDFEASPSSTAINTPEIGTLIAFATTLRPNP